MNWARFLLVGCAVVLVGMVLEASLRPKAPPPAADRRTPNPPRVAMTPMPAPSATPRPLAPFIGRDAPPPSRKPSAGPAAPPAAPAATTAPIVEAPTRKATPVAGNPPPKERPIAREALVLVGADPLAEAIWLDAINDPQRSAHERSDLIEDLNEEGFPDPKHVTPDDLPLIENRLSLIEQLAPDAMDQVNADAFAEAYKDLVNMYIKAGGLGGQ